MELYQNLQEQALNHLQNHLNVNESVLLVGNRGNKNLGDELILAGLIKLLLKAGFEPNKIIIPSANIEFSKMFLKQFLTNLPVIIPEFPKGIRSSTKYITKGLKGFKSYILPQQIILGGGEILTPETKGSFRYWRWSLLPIFIIKKPKIILMGGVTPPVDKKEKKYFEHILNYTNVCLCRDFESIQKLKDYGFHKAYFTMDTSFFAINNRETYKSPHLQSKYTINLHHFSSQFLKDLIQQLKNDHPDQIEFVPAGIGRYDEDLKYAKIIGEQLNKPVNINFWHEDFHKFLKRLGSSQKVLSARLHLFLIARYIGLHASFFAYQTKLIKMDQVLSELKI